MNLLCAIGFVLAAAAPDTSADTLKPPAFFAANDELRGYLLEAAEKHPTLLARYAEWRTALERIPQVKALPDPEFNYAYFVQSTQSQYQASIMQMFPWFGTRQARGDAAQAEAEAALQRLNDERNRLFATVKRAYFDYALLSERIKAAEAQAKLLQFMEDAVRARYAAGLAMEDELLRMQNEKAMLDNEYQAMQQMRPSVASQLTTALGRAAAEPPEWPQPATLPPAPPPAPAVLAQLRVANPELASMGKMADSRKAMVTEARKMGYPMVGVGLSYEEMKEMPGMPKSTAVLEALNAGNRLATGEMNRIDALMDVDTLARFRGNVRSQDAQDDIMVEFKVTLPVWRNKVRAGIAEAEQREAAAHHDQRAAALMLENDARMALYGVEDAQRRLKLYDETLLPQAQRIYESLLGSYASDAGASFIDLLDSARNLLSFNLERARAVRDLQVSAADLERILGAPWTEEAKTK